MSNKSNFERENRKTNAAVLKIFEFLKLLYQDEATYERVVEIFKDEITKNKSEINSNNIQVILNKYINTLKVFGIKIVKENNKYKLLSSLYSINFTGEDLKAISIILSSGENIPDKTLNENIKNFVSTLEVRMSHEDKNTLNCLMKNVNYDFSFYYTDLKEQIKVCLDLCNQSQMINIIFLNYKKEETGLKCIAQEVVYNSRSALLKVYDTLERRVLEIPLQNILSISKLSNVKNSVELSQTVVYKLKNRLAKTYKLRPDEILDHVEPNGDIVIINKNEPYDVLLSRLMRYSYNCEILSPKSLKDEMLSLINKMLSSYDEPQKASSKPKKHRKNKDKE